MAHNRPYIRHMARLEQNSGDPECVGSWNMVKSDVLNILDSGPNGNNGDIQGGNAFQFDQLHNQICFDGESGSITVPYNSSLDIPSGGITISAWCIFDDITGFSSICSKGNSPTNPNYYLRNDDGKLEFYFRNLANSNNRQYETDGTPLENGKIYHILLRHFFGDEDSSGLFINGVEQPSSWLSGGNDLPIQNIDDLSIASRGSEHHFHGCIYQLEIFSNMKDNYWIAAEYAKGKEALWKSDYGVDISASPVTSGCLGKSVFRISSGGYQIVNEQIDGVNSNIIECTSDGIIYIPTGYFSHNYKQNAYGEWEFWFNLADAASILFIASNKGPTNDPGLNGYKLLFLSNGQIRLQKVTAGSNTNLWTTVTGFVSIGEWNKFNIIRYNYSSFLTKMNDVTIAVDTGTNPIIDATHQTSNIFFADLNDGDKISYSDKNGGHAIVKRVMP